MTYNELIQLLLSSEGSDWLRNEEKGYLTLKSDLDVTLRPPNPARDPVEFKESWAQALCHNEVPQRIEYELWYRSSLVKTYFLVVVDGARALLPIPTNTDMSVTWEKYAIAKAANAGANYGDFERYMSKFTLTD